MNFKKAILLGAMAAAITACGSDDETVNDTFGAPYSGSEDAATLSEDNKGAFADAAVAYVMNGNAVELGGNVSSAVEASVSDAIESQLSPQAEEYALGVVVSFNEESECGGTYSGAVDVAETEVDEMVTQYVMDVTSQFNSYCFSRALMDAYAYLDGGISGQADVLSDNSSTSLDLNLKNVSVSVINTSDEVLNSVTVNGRFQYAAEYSEMQNEQFDLTVTVNGESNDVSYKRIPGGQQYIETKSFKGANGTTYQYYREYDSFLFEPELGKVGMYDDISECGMSEGPRLIVESPSEEVAEETAAEGYEGTVYLYDESNNEVEVNFGGTDDQPCSFEPTSVVFNVAVPQEV